MAAEPLSVAVRAARRLAVTRQRLAGKLPTRASAASIVEVVRDLAYVQWDPVAIVAPSHVLSLWARLGDFRVADLDRLLWRDRTLFEHWLPFAALVRTADYPLFYSLMRRYPESLSRSWGAQRAEARRFLHRHAELRRRVLRELRRGPRRLDEFRDHARTGRDDGDWAPGSDLEEMLFHLHMQGRVLVVGHDGARNVWGRSEEFLPPWVERGDLSPAEFEREAARRAIRALGTPNRTEISHYFVRGRYMDLRGTLARLEAESIVRRVVLEGAGGRDVRYVLEDDLPLLERLASGEWEPRTAVLPPFDNLIASSGRTWRVFGFRYVREQFLPAEKRRFGTYVLPILRGERLIGRIDPKLDRAAARLEVRAIHAEADAPRGREVAEAIGDTIARLGRFLGADRVTYPARLPEGWGAVVG